MPDFTLSFTVTPLEPGQPMTNPSTLSFIVASDHDSPAVTSYELRFSDGTVTDLGKPTPEAGIISVPLPALTPGDYTVTVVAKGPAGETASDPSDPFVVVGVPVKPGKPVLS